MLARLRTDPWPRRTFAMRFAGLVLLTIGVLAPGRVVVFLLVPGLLLFVVGALAWLFRDAEPWRR